MFLLVGQVQIGQFDNRDSSAVRLKYFFKFMLNQMHTIIVVPDQEGAHWLEDYFNTWS